jgi:hypothetical protein
MRCYLSSTGRRTRVISFVLGWSFDTLITRALIVVAATLGIVFGQVAPASATVHEIVGQWCSRDASGKGALGPAGISDPTKRNFAQPLNASGFIGDVVPSRRLASQLVRSSRSITPIRT